MTDNNPVMQAGRPCVNVQMWLGSHAPQSPMDRENPVLKVVWNTAMIRYKATEETQDFERAAHDNARGLAYMLCAKKAGALFDEHCVSKEMVSLFVTGETGEWLGVEGLPDNPNEWSPVLQEKWYSFVEYVKIVQRNFGHIIGLTILTYEVGAIMQGYWSNRQMPFGLDESLHEHLKDLGIEE